MLPNDTMLDDAEKRALLAFNLNEIEGMEEEKVEINLNIKEAKKRLVGYGFSKAAIAFGLKLRKNDDADMLEKHIAEMEVARFLNHPVGAQPELPFDAVDRTPGVDSARSDGELAGASGHTCVSPHPPGSPMEQPWIEGWHDGQATLASAFKKLEAQEDAAPAEDEESDED
jgi:uncharacterized protein (UPF0335 family)